jgi:hypothetical protein
MVAGCKRQERVSGKEQLAPSAALPAPAQLACAEPPNRILIGDQWWLELLLSGHSLSVVLRGPALPSAAHQPRLGSRCWSDTPERVQIYRHRRHLRHFLEGTPA